MNLSAAVFCCLLLVALGMPVWAVTVIGGGAFLFGLVQAALRGWRAR